MSELRIARVVALVAVVLVVPGRAVVRAEAAPPAAEDLMCIDESVRQHIDECPAGAKRGNAKGEGNVPRSQFAAAVPKASEKKSGPTGPGLDIDLSQRMGRDALRAREESLLKKELLILKRLVSRTPTDDPRRPDILLRLAETQFEMQFAQNAKVRSFDDPIFANCTQTPNKAKCNAAHAGQKTSTEELNSTRKEAIQTYATLVRDHPNFDRMDEVLFSLAFGLDELREVEQARTVYRRLIKDYPRSRFIPNAYLSFAEYYFVEGDMTAAAQFYQKVVDFPPPKNNVYGFALYKLAWVEYNRERFKESLQAFVDVLEYSRENPNATDAKNLGRQARRELVMPYSRFGAPDRALKFFRRYAANDDEAMEMMESLASLYFDTGQWGNAVISYHELMATAPKSEKLCEWQNFVTNATISSKSTKEQVEELKRLVEINRTFAAQSGHPEERVTECKQSTATTLLWLATAWHREAVGTEKIPGTKDRTTMQRASILYRTLLKEFPGMESMEFPTIDKRDWPNEYRISYFYAELLWKMEEWGQCGPAFDQVVQLNPKGEYTSDAAYAAVLCYNNLYQQSYRAHETEVRGDDKVAKKTEFEPREFTELEQGMMRAFTHYVCYVENSADIVTIKYRRARIYYESNHFEEAAVLFKEIAFNHRDNELSEYAANLYLDCLNIMGTQGAKPKLSCIAELSGSIDPMEKAFCATPELADEHPDLCGTLATLQCQVRRKEAELYQANKQYKNAASTYVRIFRNYKSCGEMDEVLYNAAINFEAARLLGRAIQVRKVLIQQFPASTWAKKAVYLVGANFHALAFYENAATSYEEFARRFPGETGKDCSEADKAAGLCPDSVQALENAVFFRLGLSDDPKAEADAKLFETSYGKRMPRRASQVVFSIGSIYERQRRWDEVIRHYSKFIDQYKRTAGADQMILANTAIGKAYWELGRRDKAKPYFAAAVKEWNGGAAKKIVGSSDGSREERLNDLKLALDGAAEAQFHLSEFSFDEFQAIPFPKYTGGRTADRINKWATGAFSSWVNTKLKVLQKAESSYNAVAETSAVVEGTKVQSPPWQIAAASRVGTMYRSFVDEFRDAPIPAEIEKDAELYDIYVGALDEKSEPLQRQAVSRFEFCMTTATNVRWFNKWSRACEEELNGLDPRKYPVAAELRGESGLVKRTIGRPGAAELSTDSLDALGAEGGNS